MASHTQLAEVSCQMHFDSPPLLPAWKIDPFSLVLCQKSGTNNEAVVLYHVVPDQIECRTLSLSLES